MNQKLHLSAVCRLLTYTFVCFCSSISHLQRNFVTRRRSISGVQIYMYQLFRSLAYIHSLGICHRDIKPQNLLLNPETAVLKLCDFGSAKQLLDGEPNVSYICSRYYRAPELIFGAINYTTKIGKKWICLVHVCYIVTPY